MSFEVLQQNELPNFTTKIEKVLLSTIFFLSKKTFLRLSTHKRKFVSNKFCSRDSFFVVL